MERDLIGGIREAEGVTDPLVNDLVGDGGPLVLLSLLSLVGE